MLELSATVILAKSCAADQAHLRSHAGAGASDVLHGAPTEPDFKVEPHLFRTLVLERPWMCGAGTGLLAQGQVGCGRGLSVRSGLWPAFAEKQEPP